MPDRFIDGRTVNGVIDSLESNLRVAKEYRNIDDKNHIFGFVLPYFQRPLVWTESQKIKFLESVWLEMPIGTYIVNRGEYGGDFDNLLLDGQQRLNAIHEYLNDKFLVFGYRYSEITEIDRRRFRNTPFPSIEVRENDWGKLVEIYNRFNFGGTAHTEDQKAEVRL